MSNKETEGKPSDRATAVASRPEHARKAVRHDFAKATPFAQLQRTLGNQAMLQLLGSGTIQAKLRLSQPGDADELEADRVANQVVSFSSPGTVHRKCSCSGSGASCPKCEEEEKSGIRRKAQSASSPDSSVSDNFVNDLGPGNALDRSLRESMESRLGHDFNSVRIHTDSQAADSADAVNARAFTVGRNVVFAKGEYQPSSAPGLRLLAHELTHVVQQRSANSLLQRDDAGTKPPQPKSPPAPGGNMANKKLADTDKAKIRAAFKDASTPGAAPAFKEGPRFVLHDTGKRSTGSGKTAAEKAESLEKKELDRIAEHKKVGETPVGEGPSSYVTSKGTPGMAHPLFFEGDRPTATEYERGNDLMEKKKRETLMQTVWGLTDPKVQSAAIATYLGRFTLSKKDVTDETNKANKNLDPSQSTPNNDPANPAVLSTGGGAITVICAQVAAAKGALGIAVKGKEKELETACASLTALFAARKQRISSSTNLEVFAEEGSDCSTNTTNLQKPIKPFPAYPVAAYDAVTKLYLLAALEVGQFPEITTHFFLDKSPITKTSNRCDPRCWDLGLLYATIAAVLGHPKGTTYGVDFKPGIVWGTSTIWWFDQVCGVKPGSSGKANAPAEVPSEAPKPKPAPAKPPLTNS